MDNGVQRETFLNRTAEYLGVQKDTLVGDFEKRDHRRTGLAFQARRESTFSPGRAAGRTVEWSLLVTVVSYPELFKVLRRDLSLEDFEEERCRALLEILEEMMGEGMSNFPLEEILSRWNDQDRGSELVRDVMSGEYQTNALLQLQDGVLKVKAKTLLNQRRKVLARLDKAINEDERIRLLQEHKFLGEEISRLKGND